MPDTNPPEPQTPRPTPDAAEKIHERPEVRPLIEKAGAQPERRVPQGTMKTGGDVPGGGGTRPLELPDDATQAPSPSSPEAGED